MPEASIKFRQFAGLDLWNHAGGINNPTGRAQDCMDVYFRKDGAIGKHWGWLRKNLAQLNGRPVAIKGFVYRGKNTASTTRGGNWGQADDGAIFTRRQARWSACLVLTTTTVYRWNPPTETFVALTLPAGVTVDIEGKPTILILKDNAYIVGWASQNLRYDPTDQTLYRWGWDSTPAAPALVLSPGGTLIPNAGYLYGAAWFDTYTGEESALLSTTFVATSDALRTVNVSFPADYAGTRKFVGAGTDKDVGLVIYRTGAGPNLTTSNNILRFLTTLNPDMQVYTDTGDATDASIRPFRGPQVDEPPFSSVDEYRGLLLAISIKRNSSRVFMSDFANANFFNERWRVGAFKDLPITEGEILTSVVKADQSLVVSSQKGAFSLVATPRQRDGFFLLPTRLPWNVGIVGPKARAVVGQWLYFLSERGPHRWQEGMGNPEPIGQDLIPLFLDPASGLCKLDQNLMSASEVAFDQDANLVHFAWPDDLADGDELNQHVAYYLDCDKFLGDPYSGFTFMSPKAQCFDYTNALGAAVGAVPPSPFDRPDHFVFGDDQAYINEYDARLTRGGLPASALAVGIVAAGSTDTVIVTSGGLLVTGDGLRGFRFQVTQANGEVEVRNIVSNTLTNITLSPALLQAPSVGQPWTIGGVPSFWRSVALSFGEPNMRKKIRHVYVGHQRTSGTVDADLSVLVSVSDKLVPSRYRRVRASLLNDFQEKLMVYLSGLFWTFEFSNTHPDQKFLLNHFEVEVDPVRQKRRE